MCVILTTPAMQVQSFMENSAKYALERNGLKKTLLELPLEEFGDLMTSIILPIKFKDVPPVSLTVSLFNEIVRERNICTMCYKGIMEGGGGRGYHTSYNCSNPECRHHVLGST